MSLAVEKDRLYIYWNVEIGTLTHILAQPGQKNLCYFENQFTL